MTATSAALLLWFVSPRSSCPLVITTRRILATGAVDVRGHRGGGTALYGDTHRAVHVRIAERDGDVIGAVGQVDGVDPVGGEVKVLGQLGRSGNRSTVCLGDRPDSQP